jgi:hypothetical protein
MFCILRFVIALRSSWKRSQSSFCQKFILILLLHVSAAAAAARLKIFGVHCCMLRRTPIGGGWYRENSIEIEGLKSTSSAKRWNPQMEFAICARVMENIRNRVSA